MRVGQSAPTDPLAAYAQRTTTLEARVAEIERLLSRPAASNLLRSDAADRMLWTGQVSGTTDASGDLLVTATELSAINASDGFGAQPLVAGTALYCTVHTRSANTFKVRFWNSAGAAYASQPVTVTAWAVGTPA